MNVSQTILARVLTSVGNLLTVLGISANPARTRRTETQTHSVTWAGTRISEAGVPLVCALSSRSAVHALVCVCVCTRVCLQLIIGYILYFVLSGFQKCIFFGLRII